jgi:hypothetical protein
MDLVERSKATAPRHPWEVARGHFFQRLLSRLNPTDTPQHVLDVGSGDAWLAEQLVPTLPPHSEITCWDINYSSDDLSELSGADGLHLTTQQPKETYEGILMLDVIEHVEDDITFLSSVVAENMSDDSWMLVSVPAYQCLFTAHDSALHHQRRYSPWDCSDVLYEAGLQVEVEGGLFHSLLAVRAAQALREHVKKPQKGASGVGAWNGKPWLTRAFTGVLEAEARVSLALGTRTDITMPGLSYWAFCRRAQ